MADYFEAAPGGEVAAGAAPAPANGDAPMEDEIMVSSFHLRARILLTRDTVINGDETSACHDMKLGIIN